MREAVDAVKDDDDECVIECAKTITAELQVEVESPQNTSPSTPLSSPVSSSLRTPVLGASPHSTKGASNTNHHSTRRFFPSTPVTPVKDSWTIPSPSLPPVLNHIPPLLDGMYAVSQVCHLPVKKVCLLLFSFLLLLIVLEPAPVPSYLSL